MSYSQHYTGYVHYSGSVSYPASESGGTVSYSGTEPVHVTIHVNTTPFDASVVGCNNAIGGLTTAVVATEAAQIEAKKEASKRIGASIVKGFFQYVGADLSQKIKELASRCESLFVALMGHRDSCMAKSAQMQDDYNRITRRYSKVFEDLDKETVSRIELLDKPCFQFAEAAGKVIGRNSDTELLGISTISANESITLETLLACSHVKQEASTLLSKANAYLQGTRKLSNTLNDMLADSSAEESILLPVMLVESVDSNNHMESQIIGTNKAYAPSGKGVDSALMSKFMSADLKWEDMEQEDYKKVISYMDAEMQSGQVEERTLKTMLALLDRQSIQTIKA